MFIVRVALEELSHFQQENKVNFSCSSTFPRNQSLNQPKIRETVFCFFTKYNTIGLFVLVCTIYARIQGK